MEESVVFCQTLAASGTRTYKLLLMPCFRCSLTNLQQVSKDERTEDRKHHFFTLILPGSPRSSQPLHTFLPTFLRISVRHKP